MKPFPRFLLFLTVLLLMPAAVRAERIEQSFSVTPDAVLEVRNLNGRVVMHAWNRDEVRVVAVRRSRAVELHFREAPNHLHIHTHLLQSSAPAGERVVDFEIWAPVAAHLKVNLEAGTLTVENFSEDVTVEAVAATVLLRHLAGHISVKTLNGSIEAIGCTGRMETNSISGTLRFRESRSRFLVAKTTSGDIFFEGGFRPGGSYNFLSHQGTIELRVPAGASFDLNANTVQGELSNEFQLTPRSRGRLPRTRGVRSLLGTVHTGEAMVRVTSFSGTIRVRKQ